MLLTFFMKTISDKFYSTAGWNHIMIQNIIIIIILYSQFYLCQTNWYNYYQNGEVYKQKWNNSKAKLNKLNIALHT